MRSTNDGKVFFPCIFFIFPRGQPLPKSSCEAPRGMSQISQTSPSRLLHLSAVVRGPGASLYPPDTMGPHSQLQVLSAAFSAGL